MKSKRQVEMATRQSLPRSCKPKVERKVKEERRAPRKEMGPQLSRPGKWRGDMDEEMSERLTNLAVDYYNEKHKGDEIQLVKFIGMVAGITFRPNIAHINFMAKPMAVEHPDQSSKCFFAEAQILNVDLHDYRVTICSKLDTDSINGCNYCLQKFNMAHPPSGYVGSPDDEIWWT